MADIDAPDANLCGNGEPCEHCALRREERDPWDPNPVPCNACGGTGRVAYSVTQIVAADVAWAREHYWPERVARWSRQPRDNWRSIGEVAAGMVRRAGE